MHPVVNIALRAARSASESIIHATDRLDRVKVLSSDGHEVITSMDHDAEKNLLFHLRKAYPDYSIHSRLSGYLPGKDESNVWLIDPMHRAGNFIHGFNHICVTVALKCGDRVLHAVMINPTQAEEFTASRGNGGQLNKQRLRVGRKDTLQQALVSLAGTQPGPEQKQLLLGLQDRLLDADVDLRMTGCPALDVAYVASGKLDAGWTNENSECAMAAARLILQESGALSSDENANPALTGKEMIFGTPRCFKQLLQIRQSLSHTGVV